MASDEFTIGGVWCVNAASLQEYLARRGSVANSRRVVIEGATYIRSRDAARIVHLAHDYVSRLARERVVDGKLIDGAWLINPEPLKRFVAQQKRQKKLWRAELARQRREEQRVAGHPSAMHLAN